MKDKSRVKRLVAKYSRGSIALKLGRYVTREELEERKKRVLSYKFNQD